MNNIKEILFVGVCTIAIAAGITYTVSTALSLPDVWFSWESNECVKVVNYADGDNYTCANLPSRFYHINVK